MISRIRGVVETVAENKVELRSGPLVYEVLVPGYLEQSLRTRRGEEVEFFVQHYLEGGPGASTLIPRLVGFMSHEDRQFYSHLVKVPGLGSRTALKTMIIPPAEMARIIESENKYALAELPGVGKRTADKIIASLKGKLAQFAAAGGAEAAPAPSWGEADEQATAVLMQLDYRRAEAEELISRARKRNPELASVEDIVQAAFRESGPGVKR